MNTSTTTTNTNNQPVDRVQIGRIEAAIWENHHEKGTSYSVTVNRRYRDKDENWQTTTSFGRDDLLILAKVIDLAHTRVIELQAERW